MSTVTTEEIEGLMSTGLETTALQGVIDREEAWLADDPHVGIGQLVDARTQRIWTQLGDTDPLLLRRPTDAQGGAGSGGSLVVSGPDGPIDDVVLTGPARIERPSLIAWPYPWVDVDYIPTDLAAVKRCVIELVRLTVTSSPYSQEATEGHSYTRPSEVYAAREALARTLRPHRGAATVKLGTGASHRITNP